MEKQEYISVRGAREHNLKNIDIDIPRNKLVIITGLSGSGKSSLAFDTVYAEGHRRYVESLSAYARQFLEMMKKPDYDSIEGLSPAISIEQKTTSRNPRSTVGTITEIYDYMRLLFARIGTAYSPATGLPITSQPISQMVEQLSQLEPGARIYILAPLVEGRKGEYKKELTELQRKGFQRLKVNRVFYDINDIPKLDPKYKHYIDIVVDRLVISSDIKTRLADSLETCLELSDGIAITEFADQPIEQSQSTKNKSKNETHKRMIFSSKFACPVSGFTITEIEPRIFSFNNPYGACSNCGGLGFVNSLDKSLIIPDENLSLSQGAIAPLKGKMFDFYQKIYKQLGSYYNFTQTTKWKDIPDEAKDVILEGTATSKDKAELKAVIGQYAGLMFYLNRRWKETDSTLVREEIEKYMTANCCEVCKGYRLKLESLCIKINKLHIGEVATMSIKDAQSWFTELPKHLTERESSIATPILKEINERLRFLNDVGLDYLTLARSSATLSGGESQRIRLASQIGSGLTGVLYVLDEPSIGLHQKDNARLIETLQRLRDLGNSVLVVEHDEDAMLASDHIIDIGPAAGVHGGKIVATGTPKEIMDNKNSLTGKYLSGAVTIPLPKKRRKINKQKAIKIYGATGNNLKNVDVSVFLGVFTCITGVSGSGKSTFLLETLYKIAAKEIMRTRLTSQSYNKITGLEHIDKVIDIDQSQIGRTPRSNPATYIGVFNFIREWFASLPEAKARAYSAGRFSFNVKGGRCEACHGDGVMKIEMHFLSDIYVTCDVCKGKRYNKETLEITYKNKSIADILDMTIEEGVDFFANIPSINCRLATLKKVGLGYLKIGQQAPTLSGGEAQRVKLAKELSKRSTGKTLYILDEPTTGLHFHDVSMLLNILHDLVDKGNSVIIIEHNLDVIKTADWIIDFGPHGGENGGEVIAIGTPEQVCKEPRSYTGAFLKELIKRHHSL